MRILKFGGKSLETTEKVQNVCEFIKKLYENGEKICVVVSAMGNLTEVLTNKANEFGFDGRAKREFALLLSTGEMQSASLVSICLEAMGVKAKSFTGKDIELATFGDYINSRVHYLNKSKIIEAVSAGFVAVVCGFQGVNSDGEVTTLGLGGSDTTAAALAAAFGVTAEIFSDFDGVFAGDPRILPFKKFDKLNFDTMISMAKNGSKVLDEKATLICKLYNTPIVSKSSSEPELDGTEIFNIGCDEVAISKLDDLCKISISFSNEARLREISRIVLEELENNKFFNLEINKSEISFFVPEKTSERILLNLSRKLNLLKK